MCYNYIAMILNEVRFLSVAYMASILRNDSVYDKFLIVKFYTFAITSIFKYNQNIFKYVTLIYTCFPKMLYILEAS